MVYNVCCAYMCVCDWLTLNQYRFGFFVRGLCVELWLAGSKHNHLKQINKKIRSYLSIHHHLM